MGPRPHADPFREDPASRCVTGSISGGPGSRLFWAPMGWVRPTWTAARTYCLALSHAKSSPPCWAEAGVPGGASALAEVGLYQPQFCGQTCTPIRSALAWSKARSVLTYDGHGVGP
eukprot:scaffold26109_cov101-Isochrysis_galbana.AAC.2